MAGSGTDAAHKELDPEKLVTVQNFEVGRKPQIDALILKIMKTWGYELQKSRDRGYKATTIKNPDHPCNNKTVYHTAD